MATLSKRIDREIKFLDALFTFIINHPKSLLSTAPILASFKILIGTLSFIHSIDCDKRSKRWMLMRLIPITLYLISFYRFGKQIAIKMLQGKILKLSYLQLIGFTLSMIGHSFKTYCNSVVGHEYCFVLINEGPYQYIRHPRYCSTLIYGIGDCLFMRHYLIYLSLLFRICIYPSRINNEEKILTDFFQEDYQRYKKQVPYKVIPGIY